ncbi:outer membrane protein [Thermoflexibacter ruber]|uniref:Outer membrane protein beta-barrel domain-containing protein n=1 Tax=Thermoflexibacter ruber TaxID=1003 RepID=A0A1I2FTU0_9BACT|nr:outer membrane beta-barrel protein [Thermoflexibacter ruber]SFF08239.1 Outer membrane protein beta-barrel domain-containing protein [Thermoflexibacter ruber]
MKNLKFCFAAWLLLCVVHASFAQTEKGTWMAGGSGWLQAMKDNSLNTAGLVLRPRAGYFFRDNLAVGLAVPMNYSGSWVSDYSSHNLGIGTSLFARYYFLPSKTKLFVHGEWGASYIRNRSENFNPQTSSKYYFSNNQAITNYRAGLGLVHFITSNIGLEFTADYRKESFEFANFARQTYNFEIGLFAYFKGKKSEESTFIPHTEAKTWLVVGSIGFSSLKPTEPVRGRGNSFDFAPKIGFFVKNNLAVGLSVPILLAYNEFSSFSSSSVTTLELKRYGLNAFARYYFLPNKTKLFLTGELGYAHVDYNYGGVTFPTPDASINRFTYAFGGGLARFVSPNVALEATLDYRNLLSNAEQRVLYLQLGVSTYLRGGKK